MLCAEGGFNELDQISVPGAKAVTVWDVQGEITFFQGDITHQSLNHCHYSVLMWDTQTPEYK